MIRAQNKSVLFHFVWARRYLDNESGYSGMDETTMAAKIISSTGNSDDSIILPHITTFV
jgi:hypothetical protein